LFYCLVVELFSRLEDDGSYYSESVTAAISPCLVLTADCYLRFWPLAVCMFFSFLFYPCKSAVPCPAFDGSA